MNEILDAPSSTGTGLRYAGFWIRVGASFIDGLVLSFANGIISFSFISGARFDDTMAILSSYGIMLVIGVLYHAIMESSTKQATIGKMAVGIKVGNENGEQISFLNAVGRYFAKIISFMTLCIGYIMVGFDSKKQGLHDKIAGTYVYYG